MRQNTNLKKFLITLLTIGTMVVAVLPFGGQVINAAPPHPPSCTINITSNPSTGASVYLYDTTAGNGTYTGTDPGWISNGTAKESLNTTVPCGHCFRVWVTKPGWVYVVKGLTGQASGWSGKNTLVASGCTSDGTYNIHFEGTETEEPVPNPPLEETCGLDIVLVMDESASIDNTEFNQMKAAFVGFVNALLPDTPTEFALVDFGTDAYDRLPGFTDDATTINNAINQPKLGGTQYTNWEQALIMAHNLFPNRDKPDLIIFASDGNPTAYGSPASYDMSGVLALPPAITAANAIKNDGIRIITIGIGNELNTANLEAISSADAMYTTNFGGLATTLAGIASELCGGTITVHKVIDNDCDLETTEDQTTTGTEVADWEYTLDVTGGSADPTSDTTDTNGETMPFEISIDDDTATVTVTEEVKDGYILTGADCTGAPAGWSFDSANNRIVGIVISPQDIVSCTFYNEPDTDGDGIADYCDNCINVSNPNQEDADNDGVGDACDNCPDDPNKTEPGVCGCGVADTDSDNDGTPDCIDGCPDDPNKTEPGVCGCGVADTDSDNDGTPDCIDNCPDDPNKTEPGACGCGVADTDSDNDGTPDCIDNCPDDPNKTEPGACGCGVADTDSDNDGTPDCIDNCPDDPNKTDPGACGCGVADTDSDNDGTPDCIDGCPDDPDKTDPGVCGCGVADTDSDGDGVADCLDNCPDVYNPDQEPVCSIGDLVWADTNSDGIKDPGEDGIANIYIALLNASDKSFIADTETDANGYYIFSNLEAGDYIVDVDESDDDMPAGYFSTTYNDPMNVSLVECEEFADADFGFAPTPSGVIGDLVWDDANANGVYDEGEIGIPFVTVILKDEAGETTLNTTETDFFGNYHFYNNPTGNYTVELDLTDPDLAGYTPTTPTSVIAVIASNFLDADFGLSTTTPPPPPPGGGGGGVGGAPCDFKIIMLNEVTTIRVSCCSDKTLKFYMPSDPDDVHFLVVELGTPVYCGDHPGCGNYPEVIVMTVVDNPPPPPDGMTIVGGKCYDFTGYWDAKMLEPCSQVTFGSPVTLVLHYNPDDLPEGAFSPVVAYYDEDAGVWVILPSDTGMAAGVGWATGVLNYIHSSFAVLAETPPSPPPPPPPPPVPTLPPPPSPVAHFVVSDLSIVPSLEKMQWGALTFVVRRGGNVDMTANVGNDGGEEGSYVASLMLDGQVLGTQKVTLGPGQSQTVDFSIRDNEPGHYAVQISGLSGEFQTTVWINWWLIGGLIAAFILLVWVAWYYGYYRRRLLG